MAVQALHETFSEEFYDSRHEIVTTVVDSLRSGSASFDRKSLTNWAHQKLEERQRWLDRYFKERARVSMSGRESHKLIEPFTNVAQYFEHASKEMDVELSIAFDEFEKSHGATLYDRVLNNFKNRPVVVISAVVVLTLLAVFGLLEATRNLVS